MTLEQNKAVMREFAQARDRADYERLLAPEFTLMLADGAHSREEFLQHVGYYAAAFSDTTFEIKELIAEGDKVVTRAIYRGTHTGELRGLAPTGKSFAIDAVLIDRLEGGKVVEHRSLFDMLGLMQQLGAVPPPQPAREKAQG